jgi:UDPglucose 6-dehydrogenase
MRITVIGTGYLGAPHAAAMAALGHEVLGLDVDPGKVAALRSGQVPFHEPGLPELIREGIAAHRLGFTTDVAEAAAYADVHFLCVGTPQRPDSYAADMRHVDGAVEALLPHLRAGSLLVGKSTVPVGTAGRLAALLEEHECDLAWNPEFLREGLAVHDSLHPDRIVLGVDSERVEKTLRDVYATIIESGTPVVVTDYATAELVKVSANAFLATKISFINAMAEVCEVVGADVMQLSDALGHDDRIGRKFLNAGLGFGGGCLPKDIRAFMARSCELGVDQALGFLEQIDKINNRRRSRTVDLAREVCGGSLAGKRVAILGAAFKPNSDDIRDSPALDVALAIQKAGAAVRVYDPHAMDNARVSFTTLAYVDSSIDAAEDADVVLHLTEWDEFRTMHPSVLSRVVRQRCIVDGRNTLDRELWTREGWVHRALGRRSI